MTSHDQKTGFFRFGPLLKAAAVSAGALAACSLLASDYSDYEVESQFKSGLDRGKFAEAFKSLNSEGYRIVDIETYRSGRSVAVSTIWNRMSSGEGWQITMSQPISEFVKVHEKHTGNGYSLVEFEVDRNGATLHFSGIWAKAAEGKESEFYFGLESLDFSNRYGEMADRGYRLVDFEAYESNGKYRHAGIWIKKEEDQEVRFYRGIEKKRINEIATGLDEAGFRLQDIEGYVFEGKFVFGGQWVKRKEWQESKYSYDLLPDEFYNTHSSYASDGYRLTEFETYTDNGVVYYAGSWLKGSPEGYVPQEVESPNKKKKKLSLEEFRSGGK
ncbi:hypothetical protein [Pelagicoccus mobilis]|uniref:Lipoprotein n=1 Tax=Pelagicoccus mobilis TaxID=415221 RepID=A0A934RXM7_9BACT|nr:hypothetical protein [Pelagicoccus mobilis]MBK1877109.1 hypothetical protein [Pelagicoccus mobilis]